MLTAESNQKIAGFIIGKLMPVPEVYNPARLTLMIDDFCVKTEDLWSFVGGKLIEHIKQQAKGRDAVQILVICGVHDKLKSRFLMNQKLSIASEWFVESIL